MIKKELKFNDSSKRIGNVMDKISKNELIDLIDNKDFIKQLKPFNLADYFKDYESLVVMQSNDIGALAKILKAYEDKEKIRDELANYQDMM